jgi:hypothetical protein
VTFSQPFFAVAIQISDVRLDQFNDRPLGEKRSGQRIYLKLTHDPVVNTLAVEADTFQGTEGAMVFVIEAEDDFGGAAPKSFPVPGRVRFGHEEIPDAYPLFDGQGKGIFPLFVTLLHFL